MYDVRRTPRGALRSTPHILYLFARLTAARKDGKEAKLDSSYSYLPWQLLMDYMYNDDEAGKETEAECEAQYIGDGECDRACNTHEHNFDSGDCFHDVSGCYNDPTGVDYRGNVSVTRDGFTCQYWSAQHPQRHTYSPERYPDSNLGGHNHCRNPSRNEGYTGPWCFIDKYKPADILSLNGEVAERGDETHGEGTVWAYCDVGAPTTEDCQSNPITVSEHTVLALNTWRHASLYQHRYDHYWVELPKGPGLSGVQVGPDSNATSPHRLFPPSCPTLPFSLPCNRLRPQVVVVPESGDPNLYVSFSTRFPNGHDYTYKRDGHDGTEVFFMSSQAHGYCSTTVDANQGDASAVPRCSRALNAHDGVAPVVGSAQGGARGASRRFDAVGTEACDLFLSVSARETSDYHIIALETPANSACGARARGCSSGLVHPHSYPLTHPCGTSLQASPLPSYPYPYGTSLGALFFPLTPSGIEPAPWKSGWL